MQRYLVPIVCLLVVLPICAYFGWRFAHWYLQEIIQQRETGQAVQQSGRGVIAPPAPAAGA